MRGIFALLLVIPYQAGAAQPFDCRILHTADVIEWISIRGDDTNTCVARAGELELFRVTFTQYTASGDLVAIGKEPGRIASHEVTWELYDYDFLSRKAVLPLSWSGPTPPIRMVVSLGRLSAQSHKQANSLIYELKMPPPDQWANQSFKPTPSARLNSRR